VSRDVALVTGSSRDIGRAIALRLAQEGVSVAVHSLGSSARGEEVAREARSLGVASAYFPCDVRDFDAVGRLLHDVREQLGPVDILVNCAAWMQPSKFDEDTPDYWDRVIQTKMYGFIHTVFHALPQMKSHGWGKIVNIAGEAGRIGVSRGAVHSGVQGAVIAMTKSWAREFAPYGIRVNAVSPGPTDTMAMSGYEKAAPDLYAPGGEMSAPLGRPTPEQIAAAVAYFVRREADIVTGQILSVSGGRSFAG
jgi:2-hydroxycyclohexanecarboxyl-CoA dehydrogenase